MADKNKKAKRRPTQNNARPQANREVPRQNVRTAPMSNLEKTMAARNAAERFRQSTQPRPDQRANPNGQRANPNGQRANPNGQRANPNGQRTNQNGQRANQNGQRANPNGQRANPSGQRANPNGQRANPNGQHANQNAQRQKKTNDRKTKRPEQNTNSYTSGNKQRPIREQTPKQRKAQRQNKKLTGSAKNLEVTRHTKTKRTAYKVKRKKNLWKVFYHRAISFLFFFALIFGLFCGVFFLKLTHTGGSGVGDYTVQIGDNNATDMTSYTSSSKNVYRNGAYYIAIDALRDYCDFTVTGDSEELRYIPRENEDQYASFRVGTTTATVNGSLIRLNSPTFVSGGNLYVPISFFERYAKNMSVMHAPTESKITVVRAETAESVANASKDKTPIYEPLIFALGVDQPLEHIPEQSVDEN